MLSYPLHCTGTFFICMLYSKIHKKIYGCALFTGAHQSNYVEVHEQ